MYQIENGMFKKPKQPELLQFINARSKAQPYNKEIQVAEHLISGQVCFYFDVCASNGVYNNIQISQQRIFQTFQLLRNFQYLCYNELGSTTHGCTDLTMNPLRVILSTTHTRARSDNKGKLKDLVLRMGMKGMQHLLHTASLTCPKLTEGLVCMVVTYHMGERYMFYQIDTVGKQMECISVVVKYHDKKKGKSITIREIAFLTQGDYADSQTQQIVSEQEYVNTMPYLENKNDFVYLNAGHSFANLDSVAPKAKATSNGMTVGKIRREKRTRESQSGCSDSQIEEKFNTIYQDFQFSNKIKYISTESEKTDCENNEVTFNKRSTPAESRCYLKDRVQEEIRNMLDRFAEFNIQSEGLIGTDLKSVSRVDPTIVTSLLLTRKVCPESEPSFSDSLFHGTDSITQIPETGDQTPRSETLQTDLALGKALHWTLNDFRSRDSPRLRPRYVQPFRSEPLPINPQNLHRSMQQREFRIASMVHLSASLPLDVVVLADAGLYYDEDKDEMCCCRCSWRTPRTQFLEAGDPLNSHRCSQNTEGCLSHDENEAEHWVIDPPNTPRQEPRGDDSRREASDSQTEVDGRVQTSSRVICHMKEIVWTIVWYLLITYRLKMQPLEFSRPWKLWMLMISQWVRP